MEKEYDLVVIGTGDAGFTVASECREAGWKVAIVDKRPFGGTCALRGCNPKKAMAATAEIAHRFRARKGSGIEGELSLQWHDMVGFSRSLTEPLVTRAENMCREKGIDAFHGVCEFTGRNSLLAAGNLLHANKICIASGAKPRPLGIPGEQYITDTEQLLQTDNLPQSVLFVGGGYISFEFANIIRATGRSVSIIEALPRPLMPFDKELVDMLLRAYKEEGIEVVADMPISSIEKRDDRFLITAGKHDEQFEAQMVIHGAGRVPDYDDLNLEAGGVRVEGKGIIINENLQCISSPDIYVAGDANANSIALTPVAELDGHTVAHNLLHKPARAPNYTAIPSVVFSHPQLASVGLTEKEARRQNASVEVIYRDTSDRHISKRIGINYSAIKMIVQRQSGRLLGAHLLGYNVDEVVNFFTLAIRKNMTEEELKDIVYTFPTLTYDTIHRM